MFDVWAKKCSAKKSEKTNAPSENHSQPNKKNRKSSCSCALKIICFQNVVTIDLSHAKINRKTFSSLN